MYGKKGVVCYIGLYTYCKRYFLLFDSNYTSRKQCMHV